MIDRPLNPNAESWIEPSQLGSVVAPYVRTFTLDTEFIDNHRSYATCDRQDGLIKLDIDGWLWPEDALKLYELAYVATGDILELGCYNGLSTSILSQANHDSGLKKSTDSIDLAADGIRITQGNRARKGLLTNVQLFPQEASAYCRQSGRAGRMFDLVFIDHSHAYQAVLEVCRELRPIVSPGGFCLFHDFNDERNSDPNNADYGVAQAVADGLDQYCFKFYGIFGCCALYRAGE